MKRIAILGSTGSIGTQALDVIRRNPERYCVSVLACGRNAELLGAQALEFRPVLLSVETEEGAERLREVIGKAPEYRPEIVTGEKGLLQAASFREGTDLVLNALVGIGGLGPTLAALKNKLSVALANKETLVTGGDLVMKTAEENGVKVIPVDSEHSAVFQSLLGQERNALRRILLTASGGPFRGFTAEQLSQVTAKDALKHPNWNMGAKVTIDSASMMNKGLEIIEACHLFRLNPDQVEVLVHPESILHSAVEYTDGAVIGQLGAPDMRVPIAFALSYPERVATGVPYVDLFQLGALHFERPDRKTFRCLALAEDAFREKGNYPVILNAANEVLVKRFLQDEIAFTDIPDGISRAMDKWGKSGISMNFDEILEIDRRVRKELL